MSACKTKWMFPVFYTSMLQYSLFPYSEILLPLALPLAQLVSDNLFPSKTAFLGHADGKPALLYCPSRCHQLLAHSFKVGVCEAGAFHGSTSSALCQPRGGSGIPRCHLLEASSEK